MTATTICTEIIIEIPIGNILGDTDCANIEIGKTLENYQAQVEVMLPEYAITWNVTNEDGKTVIYGATEGHNRINEALTEVHTAGKFWEDCTEEVEAFMEFINGDKFTVSYTLTTTRKRSTVNKYKSKAFRDLSDATDFYNRMQDNKKACDVRQRLGTEATELDAQCFIKTWNIRFYDNDEAGVPTFHDDDDKDETWAETVELMA